MLHLYRRFLSPLAFLAFAGVLGLPGVSAVADDRPNIILIMADDLGVEAIGAYGCLDYDTPVLDRMASEGLKFERCYSTPLCTPTRVQLMTGRYNHRNYVAFGKFPVGELTFGNLMQRAGYKTGMVGKWQLGGDHRRPGELGFAEYCLQNKMLPAHPFDRSTRGAERYWGYPLIVADGELYDSEHRYGPDMLNEYACNFIRKNKSGPFFLYYPMLLTHSPFAPTPDSSVGDKSGAKVSEVRFFGDMVEYTDRLVGRVLATLESEGIRENTLVLFTGDNGTTYPVGVTAPAPKGFPKVVGIQGARHRSQLKPSQHATPKPNSEGPLTRTDYGMIAGGKDLMSERGVHVPLIVDWPKHRSNYAMVDHRNDGLVDFTDFLTTFVELAGTELPDDRLFDGVSIAPALAGNAGTNREMVFCHYWEFGRKREAARTSIHTKRWKLYDDGSFYDLENDLEETKPLSTSDLKPGVRQIRKRLKSRMEELLQSEG